MNLFISYLFSNPTLFLVHTVVILFSIACHEYGHAQVALWEGDDTAALKGHLTLNPFKHIPPIGLVLFAIAGLVWGAVPVNPGRMRRRLSRLLVSLAGVTMNLLLAIVSMLVFVGLLEFATSGNGTQILLHWQEIANHFFWKQNLSDEAGVALSYTSPAVRMLLLFLHTMVKLNLVLILFNMLPIPMLDGWKVYAYFFPQIERLSGEFAKGAMFFMVALCFMFSHWLWIFAEIAVTVVALAGMAIFKLLGM